MTVDQPTTDPRCLTCGDPVSSHHDGWCDDCLPTAPQHPFVPAPSTKWDEYVEGLGRTHVDAPSTADAVEAARALVMARFRGTTVDPFGVERGLASVEAAIVARERERYDALDRSLDRAQEAGNQLLLRIEVLEAVVKAVRWLSVLDAREHVRTGPMTRLDHAWADLGSALAAVVALDKPVHEVSGVTTGKPQ